MSTDKITMWEHKLLDLGLKNQLINLRLTKKTIPVFVPSLSDFEDLLVSGEDFIVVSGKDNNEVPSEQEKPAEGEKEAPVKTLPHKEFGFEDMHDISGFEDLVKEKFEKKKILTPITQNDLDDRIKNLYRGYKSSLEENGANTLYIALGLLKWYEEEDKNKSHYAPLLLVPIQIIRRSLALGYKIRIREEDTMLNISIVEKLKAEFDIRIEGLDELPSDEHGVDLPKVFSTIRDFIAVKPSWEVLESAYIGLFSFTQFVMWNDLKRRRDDLLNNNIVRSLVNGNYEKEEVHTVTRNSVDDTAALTPLPADASQMEAINAAYDGESFVLHGPPGTGKSQTITSMIANCLYSGKTVLFAAEKKAALEVVYNRLSKIGLSSFCLELHSNKARKNDVLSQLETVSKLKEKYSPDEFERKRKELYEKKANIDGYVKELHEVRDCGYSLFELVSIYESTKDAPDIAPFGEKVISVLKASDIEKIKNELTELIFVGREYRSEGGDKLSFVKGQNYSMTMKDAVPSKANEYKQALLKLCEVSSGKSLEEIVRECEKYKEGQETARQRDQILLSWDKDFLGEDARALIKEYKEAESKWALFKTISVNSVYKKVAVYDLKKDKKASLLSELESLRAYTEREALHPVVEDSTLSDAYSNVLAVRSELDSSIGLDDLKSVDTEIDNCDLLISDSSILKIRMQYNKETAALKGLGAVNLVEAYDKGIVTDENMADSLEKMYSHQLIMQIVDASSVLSEFAGGVFEGRLKLFKDLSEEFLELTKKEIYYKLASKIPDFSLDVTRSSELVKLKKAISGNARGISLRKLFSDIPNILQLLCPCMLMSPISVAQYLELSDFKFDTVIFDEASQLPTCKAIGVLARGKNAIVVGDPKQMPPTSFFMSDYVDEENIENEDLESILDDCLAVNMPSKYLRWHYRSKHESLIDFSNKTFYENRLYTFPSANDRQSMVNLVQVDGVFDRGNTRTNIKEAEAVIEEIVRRFKDPVLKKQSIGVVTFNINQQNKIDDLLQEECKKVEGLESWAYGSEEPIFIKNLENVQGDERDVILFSVGYGKDEEGNVYMNFGPLNLDGGWRRLNVAVTRARCEMKVFSTLTPEQIRITSSTSRGVQAMRRFLEYASGSDIWSQGLEETYAADNRPDSSDIRFSGVADSIIAGLTERGYKCIKDIGKSGYKIDIGVVDKDNDGVYSAGILVDGESYKIARSTRDREIAQSSVLEGLGWKVMRVWSLDWLEDPMKTLEKIVTFIETSKEEPVVDDKVEEVPAENTESTSEEELPASENIPVLESSEDASPSDDILIPYKAAISPVEAMTRKDLEDPQLTSMVQEKIWRILEQEAPISTDLLAKRLAASCGNMKATSKVRERTDYHCKNAKINKTTHDGVDYWWNADQDPSSYSKIRVAGDAATRRAASDIPFEEAVNAVSYVVRAGVGVPREGVAKDAAKLMGYSRPNADLIALFESALNTCIEQDILKEGPGGNICCQ
ncbi:MAG: DUF3320 domain-containing protein [Saccharofermentans sp.]|nr:DUF3320 domain-containing protein [Saccharofermentans sp.]